MIDQPIRFLRKIYWKIRVNAIGSYENLFRNK